jgi:hypothetical protein
VTLKDSLKSILAHPVNKKYEPSACEHKHIVAEKVVQKQYRVMNPALSF